MSQNFIIQTKKTKIVIAGGGFVGLTAARYFDQGLARRSDIDVVLISRENFTLFTPMLHEVAAGDLFPGDIVNPLRRVLHHVKVVEADVRSIDASARRIHCAHGSGEFEAVFEFDHLLLALAPKQIFSTSMAFGSGR
jgi:NADH:ubiquinone reductase (H+-translocating)